MPMVIIIRKHWHLHLGPNMTQSGLNRSRKWISQQPLVHAQMIVGVWDKSISRVSASINIDCGF